MDGFVGVHLGAGLHSEKLRPKYKRLVYGACQKAAAILKNGGSALDACAQATAHLEDSPLTNAGYGSNLTWGGSVECDASVMDGCTLHYGAVGGVSGVKNPILLAKLLCEHQRQGLPFGRVPPSFLVGEGARIHALKYGLTTVPPTELISAESWKLHQHYRKKLRKYEEEQSQVASSRLDTVGAVCMDSLGHVAATCSSGGIALKTVGRVGQAAVYASGVWAQNAVGDVPAVASCTSGCGEYLVRTMLAREGALSVLNDNRTEVSLHDCMRTKFLESPFLHDVDEKMGGMCVLKYNPSQDIGEFLWSHSTTTMCVGYMTSADTKPV
ncbi:Probable isoaspartyl peptidase/L-asparaginase GA20639, partial [Gryllus bimaculatus]